MVSSSKSLRYILGLVIFINLQLEAVVKGQFEIDCTKTDWNQNGTDCPKGMKEIVKVVDRNAGTSRKFCCNPDTKGESDLKGEVSNCRTTECSSDTNLCSSLNPFYVNGRKLVYEEHLKDGCTIKGTKTQGHVALCCQPNSTESLLVSALGAEENEFPHQVQLKSTSNCGGTIYNKRFILTAAHCVFDKDTKKVVDAGNFKVFAGTNIAGVESDEYLYKVKRVIVHEQYSGLPNHPEQAKNKDEDQVIRTFNDVALLELEKDIEFGGRVKALQLAPEKFDPWMYADTGVIVGWGKTDTLTPTRHLQKANVILRRDSICLANNTFFGKLGFQPLSEQLLCVGGILEGKWSPTASNGDSGGAAICRGDLQGYPVLCGIASFAGIGETCRKNNNEASCPPTVYADAGYFHKWIVSKAGAQDPKTLYRPHLYGRKVTKGEYQHQVHVTSNLGTSCGGTLVDKDIVVTAGHCVFSEIGKKPIQPGLKVTTGLYSLNDTGTVFGVKNAKFLPGLRKIGTPGLGRVPKGVNQSEQVIIRDDFYQDDLAVIKLDRPVSIADNKLAVLPKPGVVYKEAVELAFPRSNSKGTGFGLVSRNFKLMAGQDCQNRMNRLASINLDIKVDGNIMCGVENFSGGSTCQRELGGGLICGEDEGGRDVLCGVQVFRLCMFSLPNGFMNTGLQRNFIQEAIETL